MNILYVNGCYKFDRLKEASNEWIRSGEKPYVSRKNLPLWLTNKRGRDQIVIQAGYVTDHIWPTYFYKDHKGWVSTFWWVGCFLTVHLVPTHVSLYVEDWKWWWKSFLAFGFCYFSHSNCFSSELLYFMVRHAETNMVNDIIDKLYSHY